IYVRDVNDNTVTSSAAVVSASIGSGAATLGGVTTVSAIAGVATFSNISVTGSTPISLAFASPGLVGTLSNTFTPTAPVSGPFNLTIDGLYLTQATQTYTGTVP